MDKDLSEKIREQEKEIEFLRAEVRRLREQVARTSGPVKDMLGRRGFSIYRKAGRHGLILPQPSTEKRLDEFYGWMKRYSFRLFLRDAIKRNEGFRPAEMVRYSSLDAVMSFCEYLAGAGILRHDDGLYSLAADDVKSFGPTLEWFVSEVFRREYLADTVMGVKFKDTASGGDYDVIAALEGRLVYAEVKSSPPKQIYVNEVAAFLGRTKELGPDLSLFVVDTELRMKDKVVALFEEALPGSAYGNIPVERFRYELFRIGEAMFVVNSKDSLVANIGEVLGWYLRRSGNDRQG